MTPKEKAEELITTYLELVKGSLMYDTYLNKAKKGVLIVVNEILQLGVVPNEPSSKRVYEFYSQVKIEIEKL